MPLVPIPTHLDPRIVSCVHNQPTALLSVLHHCQIVSHAIVVQAQLDLIAQVIVSVAIEEGKHAVYWSMVVMRIEI